MAETLAHHYEHAGDVERAVELYLAAAQHAMQTFGFEDALSLGRRAARLAQKNGATVTTFVQCDLIVGKAMVLAGQTSDARAFLESAVGRPEAHKAADPFGELHVWLARACMVLGTVDVGQRAVDRALTLLDARTHPAAVARLYVARGELRQRTDPAAALKDAQRAMELWKNKPSVDEALRIDELISVAAQHAGDPRRALEAAQRRATLAQREGRVLDEIPARRRLAEALSAMGDRLKARKQLNDALELAIRQGHKVEEALLTKALGDQLLMSGAYSEAISRFQNAATKSAQLGQITERALCLRSIGRSYYAKGEYDRALDHLRAALDAFDKQGDASMAVSIRCDVALAMLAKGNADEAQETLKVASKKLPEKGLDHSRGETYAAQGLLFTSKGDFKRARMAFLHAVAIFRRVHDRYTLAEALVGYAQLLLRVGEPRRANRMTKRAEWIFADLDAGGQLKRIQPLINATQGLAAKKRDGPRVSLR